MTRASRSGPPAAALLALLVAASPVAAAVVRVPADHARITDALAAAAAGDTVAVAAGTYSAAANGEVFPLVIDEPGLVLLGAGADSCALDADSLAGVLRITVPAARVTGFTIRHGLADRGGGVFVAAGSPELDHNLFLENLAALAGAAIYAAPGTSPHVHHNVVWRSRDTTPASGGDPHGIQIDSAHGLFEHNLVGRGDSNSLIVTGTGAPVIRNNIFFANGIPGVRGRGICALGSPATVIEYNLFHANEIAAIVVFVDGTPVDVSAEVGNDLSDADGIAHNLDGDPLFVDADAHDWRLLAGSPAIDAGDPAASLDRDGTRADIGPFAFDQSSVGVPAPAPRLTLAAAPNPALGAVTIDFTLPRRGAVRLTIRDVRGRAVAVLAEGEREAGPHRVAWGRAGDGGAAAPAGIYFAVLEWEGGRTARKVVVVG